MLPFTAEVFFSVFEQYNRAIWPAQIIAYGLGLAAVLLTLRPVPGGDRFTGAILAAAWAWIGGVYYLMHLDTIDFAAPVFGALFVIQAFLLAWTGAVRGRLAFRARSPKRCSVGDVRAEAFGWIGLGLMVYAMAPYPVIGWLAGHGWPSAPLFGVAPCPTTIFTIGLLLLTEGRTPLHLVVIPVLVSLYCGMAAWLLNLPEDLALPLAGVGGLGLMLWRNRR